MRKDIRLQFSDNFLVFDLRSKAAENNLQTAAITYNL